MVRAALLAIAPTFVAALLTPSAPAAQGAERELTFVAFRVDGTHVVATLKVLDTVDARTDGLSAHPAARFGFPYFDAPPAWRAQVAADAREGERWIIESSAGREVSADAERVVGGQLGCQGAIGVLLRVVPESADAFAALPARYFLAGRARSGQAPAMNSRSAIRERRAPSNDAFRRALEVALNELLVREFPGVRSEAEPEMARMAASPVAHHRDWARRLRAIDDALQGGRGQLRYDIQSFHLSPDANPVHFVRAEWIVDGRQGFAASIWVRGEERLEIVDTNLRPAHWLRMSEFDGQVTRENLGLVLNVFDRGRKGWADVLMAQGGYEGLSLSVLQYSEQGFRPTGIEYRYGC